MLHIEIGNRTAIHRKADRHQGNDRRAPVLEEEEDDEDDEYEGDDKRAEDVLHAGVDARGAENC